MKTVSWGRLTAAAVVAAVVPAAMLWVTVRACGPDFEPEVFVSEHHPDQPARFVEGHLGILQSGYYHADLVVAYRILSGGKLSDAEKAAYGPAMQASDGQYDNSRDAAATQAMNEWQVARAAAVPGASPVSISEMRTGQRNMGNYSIEDDELNCTDGAFLTAAKTLQARVQTWGADSLELKEWLTGQDSVFANCNGAASIPGPAKPEWKVLLREDRAYQIASANFYAGNYDNAIADFVAIGKDKISPWSRWGEYLAARAEVRKAAYAGKPANGDDIASFDNSELQAAETRLQRILSESSDAEIRHAAQAELNFVLVRLEPTKRLDAAASALAGPNPDSDFAQDLADLDVLMDRKTDGDADLVRWIEDMQGNPSKNGTISVDGVLSRWKEKQTLPWLVATLSRPPIKTGPSADALSAAAGVKPDSPAFQTVSYYRALRMIEGGRSADARSLLTAMLAGLGPNDSASTRNELLGLRMETARGLTEFLADAPRMVIAIDSEAADMAQCNVQLGSAEQPSGPGRCAPLQFDADAAGYMDTQMPLSMLKQAAESDALPAHLRQAVAEMAWVRALGLGDAASVKQMSQLLPQPMRATAGASDGFPATLALLRAPGVRPFLDQGVQRSASFSELDHFRDNWWCGRWTDDSVQSGAQTYGPPPIVLPPLGLLTPQQRQEAEAEAARINALPQGLVWVGQRAMAYVKAHPTDKAAPEALALIVHGTRYGCAEYNDPSAQKAVSKEAFEMLHRLYPKSEWALKTKYYY